jgi:hypothetical protein
MPFKNIEDMRKWRREYARKNSNKRKEWAATTVKNIRARVFARYGSICVLCGYNDVRALDLDHIRGRPSDEKPRKASGRSYTACKRALAAPDGEFRILCRNCNWIAYLERSQIHVKTPPLHQ